MRSTIGRDGRAGCLYLEGGEKRGTDTKGGTPLRGEMSLTGKKSLGGDSHLPAKIRNQPQKPAPNQPRDLKELSRGAYPRLRRGLLQQSAAKAKMEGRSHQAIGRQERKAERRGGRSNRTKQPAEEEERGCAKIFLDLGKNFQRERGGLGKIFARFGSVTCRNALESS